MKEIQESKQYKIVIDIYAAPEVLKDFREKLDEMCDCGPEEASFLVYDENGNKVLYGEE